MVGVDQPEPPRLMREVQALADKEIPGVLALGIHRLLTIKPVAAAAAREP